MGQSASKAVVVSSRRDINNSHRFKFRSAVSPASPGVTEGFNDWVLVVNDEFPDYISELPDECLACIFQSLSPEDRKVCSLVCRRWLQIEGQSRHRISLKAEYDLITLIPAIFSRFDAVTKLALKCERRAISIDDNALILISLRCRNLMRLKLRSCKQLTAAGMEAFSINCKSLKKLSCGSCTFGAKGVNAVLDNCSQLEELSVKRLRESADGASAEPIRPGVASSSLKTICLKDLYNGQCFGPLLMGSNNLRTLKLLRCSGDWDRLLRAVADRVTSVVELHLERIQISDVGLAAMSSFCDLQILHLNKTPECTNMGLVSVAERCKLLRKLHIDGWKANRIGDEGLIAVSKHCPNLQELVLIGVNPTSASLEMLASNCLNLERLALCGSDTVGDAEISCIASKCMALKKLCIKCCPVSDHAMEALVGGCPNLIKVKVKKCKNVTSEGADWLLSRGSVSVNLDNGDQELQDASASDGGTHDNGMEFPPMPGHIAGPAIASSSSGRSTSLKSRLGLLNGRSLVACTLRRWTVGNRSSRNS